LLLKGARKKELLENGSMEAFLNLVAGHFNKLQSFDETGHESDVVASLEVMQSSFEALCYLLPSSSRGGGGGISNLGGDNMMSSSSRLCALAALDPAGLICRCLSLLLSSGDLEALGGQSSGRAGDQCRMNLLAEEIVETACDILASLSFSQDAQVFSVGDAVYAQWRRRGNIAFPGRITRICDHGNVGSNITNISTSSVPGSNITFDISYDDGDREEHIPMDRVTHRSSVAYYNASGFLLSFVACDGPSILWNLLAECGSFLPEDITISILSVLSSVMESMGRREVATLFWKGVKWGSETASWFDEAMLQDPHMQTTTRLPYAKVLFNMVSQAAFLKSSSRLVMQALNFYRVLAESSVRNKNRVYATGAHALSILCLSSFPHHPKVLCQSLKLLSAIASKDGTIEAPTCLSSSGPAAFSHPRGAVRGYLWQSEDRAPSEEAPHWIDICLPPDKRWREVQLYLGDYGSYSPELIVVKYTRHHEADATSDAATDSGDEASGRCFEIKRANIAAAEGWVTLVSQEEVSRVVARETAAVSCLPALLLSCLASMRHSCMECRRVT
jgi:hypothetical protein